MKQVQQGATLIVVLILLVVITVLGTLAIRQSMVTLNIATNSQAMQLMLQNADSAFFNVEKQSNIVQALSGSGMFGYIDGATNKDKELVFCYRGADQKKFFDLSNASIVEWNAPATKPKNNSLGKDGFCKVSDNSFNFFTSGRKADKTQVDVKFATEASNDPFYGQVLGTDGNTVKLERSKPVKVFAISIMPSLTSADKAEIDKCLSEHMNDVTIPSGVTAAAGANKSVTQCLSDLNVPFESTVTEYVITQDFV